MTLEWKASTVPSHSAWQLAVILGPKSKDTGFLAFVLLRKISRESDIQSSRLLFRLSASMPDICETEFGLWPTPDASEGGPRIPDVKRGPVPGLKTAVKLWPTTSARDWKSGKSNQHGKNARPLNEMATLYATPRAIYGEHPGMIDPSHLTGQVQQTGASGQLNPNWVEWLMGYPIGHTALKVSATRSSRKRRK